MQLPTSLNTKKQYLITAYDYTDDQALTRRLAVREAHLAKVRELKATGNFLQGGAILNAEGTMIGSALMMAFDTEKELNNWLATDPYVTGQVWDKIDVKPFRCAVL